MMHGRGRRPRPIKPDQIGGSSFPRRSEGHAPLNLAWRDVFDRRTEPMAVSGQQQRLLSEPRWWLRWVANRLMRVIPRLGYRLTEFAYLAAASRATRAGNLAFPCKPDGYLLGSYRIATTPAPNSSRLTSFKSRRFDSPANNVGP